MKVFLSWSGEKSRALAEALREWLPYINSEIKPWMSGTDVEPGARWSNAIAEELNATSFGIVCVTRENQTSPWLNFEAGALAKKLETSRVVPLAIDLKPTDVRQPLGQFQVQEMTKDGILNVVRLLDALCDNHVPDVLKACERNWPDLAPKLEEASSSQESAPVRDERDLLDEILTIVRGIQQARLSRLEPDADTLSTLAAWIREEVENVEDVLYRGRLLHVTCGSEPDADAMNRVSTVARGFGIEDVVFHNWPPARPQK